MNLVVDILLVGILLLYFFRGWDNGLTYAVVNIAGVVGSYIIAAIFAPFLSTFISEKYDMALVIGYLISWTSIFLFIVFIFWILKRTALKNITYHVKTEEDFHLPLYSKIIGGTVSLMLGTVVVAITILLYGVISGGVEDSLPDISGSKVVDASSVLSKRVAYTGIKNATGNKKMAKQFAVLLSRPHRTMHNLRRVVSSPKFRAVVSDPALFDAIVEKREVDISNNPALIAMLLDQKVMKSMYLLGLVHKADYKSLDFRYWLSRELVSLKFDKVVVKKRMSELRHAGLLDKSKLDKLLKDKRFHEVLDQLFFSEQAQEIATE